MKVELRIREKSYSANLLEPIDISIPLKAGTDNVNAWYSQPVKIEPVRMGDWIGDIASGGNVNTRNVTVNPHGNGTHTECLGHISKSPYNLNTCLKQFHFTAKVVTIDPVAVGEDKIIKLEQVSKLDLKDIKALIIRTTPNDRSKLTRQYSNTNPPFLSKEASEWICTNGIEHLLIDLPSVDKEHDDGKLSAHHAFWQYPDNPRISATISELIYVPDEIADGLYLLNIQITALENDASPSKPVLFKLNEK